MRHAFFKLGFLSIFFALTAAVCLAQNNDEKEIKELQDRQATAWNEHDATAYANLFTADGEVVNVVGWWWKDRKEIETKLKAAFAFVFKESKLTITDVSIRIIKPDIAIAHVQWTMTGAKTPPNIPEPKQGTQLQVLKKQEGRWLIFSFQNTASLPETPFPLEPPTSDP